MSVELDLAGDAWKSQDPSRAVNHLAELFRQLQEIDELALLPAGVREADVLLEEIGLYLHSSHKTKAASARPLNGDLIIATYFYPVGGHAPVARDLANSLAVPPLGLWLTMCHPWGTQGLKPGSLKRTGLSEVSRLFDGSDQWSCAQQLVDSLAALRPARIFLLHHPYDCAAVIAAAAARAMGASVSLLHHGDMRPSAGLYLSGIRIIDFTPRASCFVRSILGLPSAYLPLVCPDPGRKRIHFRASGCLTTGLSGNEMKVAAMKNPAYPELVSEILSVTGGMHIHIGPLSPDFRKSITARLEARNLSVERFRYIEQTESLTAEVRRNQVDLMINTFPFGGARTAVEVMAAGIPMLWHSPCAELDCIRAQMKYPLAPVWRTVENLRAILMHADGTWLEQQGESARSRYEQLHHPRIWKDFFAESGPSKNHSLPAGVDASVIMREILELALERKAAGQPEVGPAIESIRPSLLRRLIGKIARTLRIIASHPAVLLHSPLVK